MADSTLSTIAPSVVANIKTKIVAASPSLATLDRVRKSTGMGGSTPSSTDAVAKKTLEGKEVDEVVSSLTTLFDDLVANLSEADQQTITDNYLLKHGLVAAEGDSASASAKKKKKGPNFAAVMDAIEYKASLYCAGSKTALTEELKSTLDNFKIDDQNNTPKAKALRMKDLVDEYPFGDDKTSAMDWQIWAIKSVAAKKKAWAASVAAASK